MIQKDELKTYYIDNNYGYEQLMKIFNCSKSSIIRAIKRYNLYKPKELKNKIREQTCLRKYGVKNITVLDSVKTKREQTCLERFGSTSYFSSEIGKECILTKLQEKYDVINPSQISKDKNVIEIINDKEKLKEYIITNSIKTGEELATKLGCNTAGICRKINSYDLNHLLDRSQSLPEKQIKEYIEQFYKTVGNNRSILDGKEIDIYIPDKKIGIEFNGNYWHSEIKVDKNYHQNKSILAESKGIFIYHIFEYEWVCKREQVLSQLNNLLGINQNKIYARKCTVRNVSIEEKSTFLKLNHLQGDDKSSVKLGLYYNNELVSIMTFVKPRFNKSYQWELSRFCSKAGTNIIGGASKLWKYFIVNYNPESVISYSNISHTKGNLYGMLGFTLQRISEPNYVWCGGDKVLSRYQCQKHKLLEQGFEGNSESSIMKERGFLRIFDCGNKVWIWSKIG